MAKIKKSDINKLSKLDQQIEELKKQKQKQQEELSISIGKYILSNIDFEEFNSTEELYELLDKAIYDFKNDSSDNSEVAENNPNENEEAKNTEIINN